MSIFICNETDCANAGVVYDTGEETEFAVCGGCKIILFPSAK